MVVVIDYNVGNLGSVTNAMRRLDVDVVVTNDHDVIRQADGIILPGVGSFPAAMKKLAEYDLIEILNEMKAKGVPMLGICLGMQLLFEDSYEFGYTKGLGFLEGSVKLMEVDEKIPHMGWNELHFHHDHPLLKHIKENDYVYFVHSYVAHCTDEELIAYSDYGHARITAMVAKDNVMGCQFHPEKSGEVGKRILKAFKEMVEAC